jgi:hypothetical protein
MHVIWKRPDGFHGADPTDYVVVNVGSRAKIWLHRRDNRNFPFRIAGDWKAAEASERLNLLVNLLGKPDSDWTETLLKLFNDTLGDDPARFVDDLGKWLLDLRSHLKGDTWELDIMNHSLAEVADHLGRVRSSFLAAAHHS